MDEADNRYDLSSQIRRCKDDVDNYLRDLQICSHGKVILIRPLKYAQSTVSGSAGFMFSKGIYRTVDLQAVGIPDSLQTWVLNRLYSRVSASFEHFEAHLKGSYNLVLVPCSRTQHQPYQGHQMASGSNWMPLACQASWAHYMMQLHYPTQLAPSSVPWWAWGGDILR